MKADHEIIELYWARSESAVHETDEKYGAKLHTLSGRILPEAEDAEECVNDTYLGAWNAMPLLVYGFRKSHRRKVRLRRKPRQNVPPPHA